MTIPAILGAATSAALLLTLNMKLCTNILSLFQRWKQQSNQKMYLSRYINSYRLQKSRNIQSILVNPSGKTSAGEKTDLASLLPTYFFPSRIKADRENPFRFILNHSQATAPNVYHMLYPKPQLQILLKTQPNLLHQIWQQLNTLPVDRLLSKGRLYGGGLHKLEPNELANVSLDDWKWQCQGQ